jgi:hypothetical protein
MDLQDRAEKLEIHVNWVFVLSMLHTQEEHIDKLVLSTTEREFIQPSKYVSHLPASLFQMVHYIIWILKIAS